MRFGGRPSLIAGRQWTWESGQRKSASRRSVKPSGRSVERAANGLRLQQAWPWASSGCWTGVPPSRKAGSWPELWLWGSSSDSSAASSGPRCSPEPSPRHSPLWWQPLLGRPAGPPDRRDERALPGLRAGISMTDLLRAESPSIPEAVPAHQSHERRAPAPGPPNLMGPSNVKELARGKAGGALQLLLQRPPANPSRLPPGPRCPSPDSARRPPHS